MIKTMVAKVINALESISRFRIFSATDPRISTVVLVSLVAVLFYAHDR